MDILEDLVINKNGDIKTTPIVEFYVQEGKCSIKGESYLEDAFKFYDQLTKRFEEYFESGNTKLDVDIKLFYFNTSTSRCIQDLIFLLKDKKDQGNTINLRWFATDDEMRLEAEDMAEDTEFEFEIIDA